ncbi:beta-1,3-glucanase family protein [Actinomadura alba]|uniref:beta-1,3-glucanase family protein n=1 Tax=Actinomadura alba TaxID=406431 RepID=UPI00164F7F51|nr:beta-1,3-glucanase family protein [Actinomadura alba]
MTLTRRTFLGTALAAGVLSSVRVPAALAAERLPLSVANDTGRFASGSIWMYVVGSDLTTGQQGYVRGDGTFVPASPALNGPDGYADLSVPITAPPPSLPHMSGRIYFSIEQKLKFRVVTDGGGRSAFQYPAGWVSADPSYPVLHDCVEFTFGPGGMFCNTTMVDMLSIPMAIRLVGAQNQTTGTFKAGGRARVFEALRALPDFRRLIIGDDLRVIAPGHGINAGLFAPDYLAPYIDEVWAKYRTTDLSVRINATTYTARVQGDLLTFGGGVAAFRKPTTKDVFFCDGALGAPNDGRTGPVAAVLGAAFNRAVLRDHAAQPTTDPALYYRTPLTNHYSRVMHENTIDGRAYGFAFDDVLDFASYIQDLAPTSFTVTLTPFGGGGDDPTLLSAGRPATASSTEGAGLAAGNVVDGNAGTRWSSAFADPQWVSVDLGSARTVSRVRLRWEAAYARAYRIETSTNGTAWSTVHSTAAGDGGTDDVTFPAVAARHVRVYGTQRATPYGYSLWEMEVYGT